MPTSALLSGFTEPAFLRRRHSCRSSGSSALHLVGADGERSRQRRRSATDAAYPLRVHIGPFFRYSPEVPLMLQRRICVSDGSSSQTPSDASLCIRSAKPIARRKACALGASRNPSPRRRRQVSSVPLLVLSKLQTLRWFAIRFLYCALPHAIFGRSAA